MTFLIKLVIVCILLLQTWWSKDIILQKSLQPTNFQAIGLVSVTPADIQCKPGCIIHHIPATHLCYTYAIVNFANATVKSHDLSL